MQVGGVAPGRMVYIYMDYISLLEERRQVCFDRVEAVDLDVRDYSFLRDVFTQRAPKDTVHLLEGRLLGVEEPVIWLLASCNVHTAHLWHPVHMDLKADYCHGLPKATKMLRFKESCKCHFPIKMELLFEKSSGEENLPEGQN